MTVARYLEMLGLEISKEDLMTPGLCSWCEYEATLGEMEVTSFDLVTCSASLACSKCGAPWVGARDGELAGEAGA